MKIYVFSGILALSAWYAVADKSGYIEQSVNANASGENGSEGKAGCPGGTDPDENGNFYIPGTTELCNPGSQDAVKSWSQFSTL